MRAEKNWSQEKLSEASGLSLRTIQRIETSEKASADSVQAIATVFGVDSKALIAFEEKTEMTPLEAIKMGFVKCTNFSDRATRFEYWWFMLFVLFLLAIMAVIADRAYQIAAIIVLLPLIAVSTRRLKDAGHSGWWQLLYFVPFGIFVVFYLCSQESQKEFV